MDICVHVLKVTEEKTAKKVSGLWLYSPVSISYIETVQNKLLYHSACRFILLCC
jgi:hypothetical protein